MGSRSASRRKPALIPPVDADPVLDVMMRELRRSMEGFDVPGSPRPYFMGYSLRRVHSLRLRAAYGSLIRAREDHRAGIYCEVRVGDHHFDNVIDAGLDTRADERESAEWVEAPDDLDPRALHVALWKLGQLKFDEALEDYYDHKKAMVSEYLRDEVDALTREPPLQHREPLSDDPFPRAQWEAMLREASRAFLRHPEVHDPGITLTVERVHRWMATSEGTQVITEDFFAYVDVGGWVLTEDGVYTEAAQQRYARVLSSMPDAAGLRALVDEVLAELSVMREADTPGAFIGPALLAGQAASTLFHEALGHRLEGDRLVARGETRTFAHKLGQRILPAGIDVFDDPTATGPDGQPVWGSYRVDDEGVPAQRALLVEDGVLRGFLHGRTPTRHSRQSNGHGRHDGLAPPMSRMAHLTVVGRPDRAKRWDELEHELVELAKRQGRKEAMIIVRVHGGETSTQAYDFQVFKGEPAEVWVIDVGSGERRRVRDVELIGTPLAALQRVVAFGGEPGWEEGYCYAESGSIPVSGMAPALLLSEIEMQQRSTHGFHEPLLPPPFADDGSRGRTVDHRKRGRRRRS
ncbi:TldD/PmbA family protein [Paraliomyxa miuraensis]|uniref:TldD/PmbA family protein n=1 Tax=Paraliomyxa miuraensis TaxID=376150 RepID=UPI0022529959|nr:TldD/PmbA family protein [Paraliomyxa miuraensis]MCX4245577.1 TldD/PmbA family protein [Paraliomyxa miuraensis]